ncbi:hypothetical protein WT77_02180 [Burkholderia stagnalis]|uniref:metallophosphoesterase n=1 Tax=Burkholderia stagnalis TaxID=1503054 RepID=UPI00075FB8CB|nr:metallophosphoesterase [Burkholderia stagnalis]KWK32481.1 hypothetical protein WT77_02180 [Burkholderia stagnalis]
MGVSYIHLSDIHFGQEKGGTLVVHDDVKARLVDDVRVMVRGLPEQRANGIIISGDIAYAGRAEEYRKAADWLDQLAAAAGCPIVAIQMVPGNHDVDRTKVTHLIRKALEDIAANGEPVLDEVLKTSDDRELFYSRFEGYRPFAEGYGCPLDFAGGNAGARTVEIAPNRILRFIGLNTALLCGGLKEEYGKLLLGARQRVVPIAAGEEVVLIAHHPLGWLQDSDDAARYIRNRARVLITGHEHNPSARVEKVRDGCDVMMLAAGAAVPPHADDGYTYTYNILQFAWDAANDRLQVTVTPRSWSDDDKEFRADGSRLGDEHCVYSLGCPNFREAPHPQVRSEQHNPVGGPVADDRLLPDEVGSTEGVPVVSDQFAMLRLQFFRDLIPARRIEVLVKLGALPADWTEALTHPIEAQVLEELRDSGRLDDLKRVIDEVQQKK